MRTLKEWDYYRTAIANLQKWIESNQKNEEPDVYEDIVRVLCIVLSHEMDLARPYWDLKN